MLKRKLKIGLIAASAVSAAMPLLAGPAFADMAPIGHNSDGSGGDVVGVGSDTVQFAGDFVADGDFLGDTGWNSNGPTFRIVNFDATPDANARLAYGSPGVGTGTCPSGLGGTAGTGNQTTTHADQPCTLNPSIVLREGLLPVQRPNGSGAGANAGAADTKHYIDFVRASSKKGSTLSAGTTGTWDDIEIGNDPLQMLTASTTNAPTTGLSTAQLNSIYSCTTTNWSAVGGTAGTIIPILPQVGSGTRSSFLTDIGPVTLGSCVVNAEENDPFAIAAQGANSNLAVEPMSGGRLNLFKGKLGNGTANGVGGYFIDPSCQVEATTPAGCVSPTNALNPAVTYGANVGSNASDGHPVYSDIRKLYIYFRDSDVKTTTPFGTNIPWEPNTTLDFVRALLYNPCSTGQTGCVTVGTQTFGPGGAPFFASAAGQGLISAAGIAPIYTVDTPGL